MTLPTDASTYAGIAGAPFPCSLGGRPYILDLSKDAGLTERTIPLLRNQADNSQSIAENSLNPEDLLRRAAESFHLGAGQVYRDREDSSPYRFNTSECIHVWKKWELRLHWGTKSIKTLSNEQEGSVLPAGAYLYLTDGNSVYHSNSALTGTVTWTTVTGTPASTAGYMATDGNNVYVAFGANGIYTSVAGNASMSSLFTGTINYVWYVKGRLLAANGGGVLYNPTDFTTPPNALPAALIDKGNDFIWMSACEGINHIYAAGFRQDSGGSTSHSEIYKMSVRPDGTALDVPTAAAAMPDGEIVRAMCGYLGYVVLGVQVNSADYTGGAIRLCEIQGDGNLVLGPRIEVGNTLVFSFEPEDRFVYFQLWRSLSSSGIGRLDLSKFTAELTPAWAYDLTYTGSNLGYARAQCTHQGLRVMRIGNDNLVCEDRSTKAPVGDIYFGKITYGVPDNKVAMFVDVTMSTSSSVDGVVAVYASVDGGARTLYGATNTSATIDLSAVTGKEIEISLRLSRGSDVSLSPVVTRVTLRSFIQANRTREWVLPIVLRPRMKTAGGVSQDYVTRDEIDAIKAMVGTVVVQKVGTKTEYVQVKDYEWRVDYVDENSGQLGGICYVKTQVVA